MGWDAAAGREGWVTSTPSAASTEVSGVSMLSKVSVKTNKMLAGLMELHVRG